jgi:small ligand-binding sensory domain FIST
VQAAAGVSEKSKRGSEDLSGLYGEIIMPFAAALSTNPDTRHALGEVCTGALDALRDRPDLALLFFSPYHADDVERQLDELHKRLGASCLLGCSGESIVGNEQEIEQRPALSLWLARWARAVGMEPFHLALEQTPSGAAIRGLPHGAALSHPQQSVMLLLGDPFSFRVDVFLQLVNEKFKGLRVMGGMASGGKGPGQCKLLFGNTMPKQGAVGVLLSGLIDFRCIVSQGCRPIGKPFVVTGARENIILELEGRPPLAQLQQLWPDLSPRDQQLVGRELLIGRVISESPDDRQRSGFLVRSTLDLDRGSGALRIDDRARVGETVQFLVRDADTADEGLHLLLQRGLGGQEQKPSGALLFTCTRRGSRLFSQPHHDAGVLRAEAGNIPVAGFFAQGEFGPLGDQSYSHAHTASVVLFAD